MSVHLHPTALAQLDARLSAHAAKDVLRFITCGSVDDGKSTLIGRLLHDMRHILEDQLVALEAATRRHGTVDEGLDLALLVDGLSAEREQGITIDVAYRFFSTERRSFIVADTPGHEQYTRNMATGASTAELAVLLVDARRGLTRQTRRHALMASMLGIRRAVLAVNKMDLVEWSRTRFEAVLTEFRALADGLNFLDATAIPLSALTGENVAREGDSAGWYEGPTLLEHLETVPVGLSAAGQPLRVPVQYVSRRRSDFRGYAGLVAAGSVAPGDAVRVWPSGASTSIVRIVGQGGDASGAQAGQSVMLALAHELDVTRGDLIAAADSAPRVSDRVEARLFWFDAGALKPGRELVVRLGSATANATVERITAVFDLEHAQPVEGAPELGPNDVGIAELRFDRALAFDPYALSRDTGGLLLIDRESMESVGMGLVL